MWHKKFAIAYVILLLLILNLISISDWVPTSEFDFKEYKIGSNNNDASTDLNNNLGSSSTTHASTRSGELVDSTSIIIDVHQQDYYFIELDPTTDSLEPIRLPDKAALLPEKAKSALERIPGWLYNDLAEKFIELSEINIDAGFTKTIAFADLDADGDFDLTVGNDTGKLNYYENRGTIYEPVWIQNPQFFEYYNKNIVFEFDISVSDPFYIDIDADGDMDLFIGVFSGEIIWGLNTGTPTAPDYSSSWEALTSIDESIYYSSPTFADLDNDGDFDLTFGEGDGSLYYYENAGTPTEPLWNSRPLMFLGIDAGDRSKPTFADMDNDGDLDLTIGGAPNIVYYRNIGSVSNPIWFYDATIYSGIVDISLPAPELSDLNKDGCYDLCIGSNFGDLYYYENIGSTSDPQWQIWSSYQVFPGIAYYDDTEYLEAINPVYVDTYADLILNNEYKYVDEIAFAIAHTSTQVLMRSDVHPEMFVDNAKFLYLNDKYIDYADIVDYGDFSSGTYYSTVKYYFNNSYFKDTRYIPRNIYYWYIVHPKITDEIPTYIDPETGAPEKPPTGKFWRDYLFNHNDASYPPDPDIDDDGVPDYHYPKDEGPPSLRDKLAGIQTLYNGIPYNAPGGYGSDGHNNSRPWGYKDHAIEAVSNWVAKTLPLNQQEVNDEERPIQPVRIAHHHNGNCGELQDLTTAAARTALIPATGVLLLAEDHVWIEFYESGWRQWDNYWSDGGSVVDNFGNYWYGWGQRGGSGVQKWHGDDHTSDVTDHYVPEVNISYITARVLDHNGNPVDGARVMAGSHWLTSGISDYQVTLPFPSIWNYTDANGECGFMLATQEGMADGNKNFSFKVISKVGSAEQGKTELERGVDYTFQFELEGAVPKPRLRATELEPPVQSTTPNYRFELEFEVLEATQYPPNPEAGNYHPQDIPTGLHIDSFICNSSNYNDFANGYSFECYALSENINMTTFSFEAPYKDNWYFVLSNEDAIETTKSVLVEINLYSYPQTLPTVVIANPQGGASFIVEDTILINGNAMDDDGSIVRLELNIIEPGIIIDLMPNYFPLTGYWYYSWNTSELEPGIYNLVVKAFDNNLNDRFDSIFIELIDPGIQDIYPPKVDLEAPGDNSQYYTGDLIEIEGNATDNFEVVKLDIRIGNERTDITSSYQGKHWSYYWDTQDYREGDHEISVYAFDAANNMGEAVVTIELLERPVDSNNPLVEILSPVADSVFEANKVISIQGEASDDMSVDKLELSLDGKLTWLDITSSYQPLNTTIEPPELEHGSWFYSWNTANLNVGNYMIYIRVFDGVGNKNSDVLTITLKDGTPPEISIDSPSSGTSYDAGQIVRLRGSVSDDVEIHLLKIDIDNINLQDEIKKGIVREDNEWYYDWQTYEGLPDGKYSITITATDVGGNQDTDTIAIELRNPPEDQEKSFLPGFEVVGILAAIGVCVGLVWAKRYYIK